MVLGVCQVKGHAKSLHGRWYSADIVKVDKTTLSYAMYPESYPAKKLYPILCYLTFSCPIPYHTFLGIKVKETKISENNDFINKLLTNVINIHKMFN